MNDKSLKPLLALIAAALWGLLLKPILSSVAQAQNQTAHSFVALQSRDNEQFTAFTARVNALEAKGYTVKGFSVEPFETDGTTRYQMYYALMEK